MLQLTDEEDRGKPDVNENKHAIAVETFEQEEKPSFEETKIAPKKPAHGGNSLTQIAGLSDDGIPYVIIEGPEPSAD